MRLWNVRAALAALALVTLSCTQDSITGPDTEPQIAAPALDVGVLAVTLPSVRISELHYDNAGTDVGERIEVSGPAGMSLAGYKLVLYNGDPTSATFGVPYSTVTLTGSVGTQCSPRGVLVNAYAVNGIQNGDPDAIALVDPAGAVVQFISYGGSFTALSGAAGGPAAGTVSRNIGVKESSATTSAQSLSMDAAGTWLSPSAGSFGACNDVAAPLAANTVASVTVTPSPIIAFAGSNPAFTGVAANSSSVTIPGALLVWTSTDPSVATVDVNGRATALSPGTTQIVATTFNGTTASASLQVVAVPPLSATRFSEIHYDNSGADINEALEVEGPAGTVLTGWKVVLYNGNGGLAYNTEILSGNIPLMCDGRGVVFVTYPSDGVQNGSPDGFALIDADGAVVEFLSYEGAFVATDGPAIGWASRDIGVSENGSVAGQSLSRNAAGTWLASGTPSIGGCNSGVGPPPPPPGNGITITGRNPVSDVPLPVGFEDQLFATLRNSSNVEVPTTFTWTSETPALVSVDSRGVVTSLGAGTAVLRVTAADGTTRTFSLPTQVAIASATAMYASHTEFGVPADGTPADDFLVNRTEYSSSFNTTRGIPNWVSYNLEQTHFGSQDRCDCFTYDPLLPAAGRYTTADYTGAGAFHGYGIDRGHLARSFDRTSGSLDNARTFYFSNIIPQAAKLNQGIWSQMEIAVGDFARFQNKEVFVVTGASGSLGTVKNEGKMTIPAFVWKVVVVLPRDQGLVNIDDYQDLETIAVIMPNDSLVVGPWENYKTTVDAVEALSGYNLLDLLPDPIEIAVESGTAPPTAVVDGPYTSVEAGTVSMTAAGSTDPDGDALTYDWAFGDGVTGTGVSQSHVYSQDGSYTVRLIVTDTRGLADTVTTMANVSNVAPILGAFAGATLFPGETYTASGTFTDPGADTWSATVNYGAGAGTQALTLSGKSFTLSNTYSASGTFTVTVGVSDDDVTATASQTVIVLTAVDGLQQALALVNALQTGGKINGGNANALSSKLDAAIASLQRGQTGAAENQLQALINSLDAMVKSGRLSESDAAPLRTLVNRIIASI